jgi:hypothetical protein
MVHNSTNTSKVNNHLSLQISEHKKKDYCIGNPGPDLGQT